MPDRSLREGSTGCEMHSRPDCDDCFIDAVNGCWEGRDGAGKPVRVRMTGGWIDVVSTVGVFALNPLYARRMAGALIEEAARRVYRSHRATRRTPMPRKESDMDEIAAQMADTLRAVLSVVDADRPYPWHGGALKQQIREDLTAYELATAAEQWPMGTSEGLSILPGGFFSRRLRDTEPDR